LRATVFDVSFKWEPSRCGLRSGNPHSIERMGILEVGLLVTLSVAGPNAPADTIRQVEREARREAVRAARRYEQILIRTAPERFGGGAPDRCDERIGRYCFWFGTPGTPRRPIPPEPPDVAPVREAAIDAYRRWFAVAPAAGEATGPLVRYLIEADRPREAVAAARTHVWAAGDSPESLLLLGFALHYARDFAAAEEAFDGARSLSDPDDRRRLDDLRVLLDPSEQSAYRNLDDEARAAYAARFWAASDPWHLEPGNERRSAHYARHVWGRVMAMAPVVDGRSRWGSDDHEILLRYGRPTSRQRIAQPHSLVHRPTRLTESFDPRAVALTPGALLTVGIGETPPAGVRSELERDSARSYYAPLGLRRTRALVVQPSVFPQGEGGVLRIDALLLPDTARPRVPVAPRGGVVILDTLGIEVGRVAATPVVRHDSLTVLSSEQRLPPGAYLYRVEIRDDSIGLGGIAQYRIDVPEPRGLMVSDILVALPVASDPPSSRSDSILQATPRLSLLPDQEVGLYAEVTGLGVDGSGAAFDVQWWVERAEDDGLLVRAARWVGERFGVVEPDRPTRVGWEEATPHEAQVVFVTLSLSDLRPGLHRLNLRVRDRVSGEERLTSRLIRIDPEAAPLPRPGSS
jgi:hypothetical protein